jgi:integrase
MARHANLEAVELVSGRWQVAVPGWLSGTGKRVRKSFSGETAAKKFAAKVRAAAAKGAHTTPITTELAAQALRAAEILKGTGISIVEAAKAAADEVAANGSLETLEERYIRAVTVGEAHWSSRYARDMGKIFTWLGEGAKKRRCSEMSEIEIDRLLRDHGADSAATVAMRRRMVLAVLRFKDRPTRRTRAAIAIADAAGVAKVLAACETAEERRVVALLAYAGIRPDSEEGEIAKLDWSAVGPAEIYVAPEVAKTKTDRHIPITPRLAELLDGRPEDGPVCPPNWKRRWQRIRKNGGIAKLQDVLRHTFASHFLAAFGEAETKQAMGHTAGSSTLFRFYRRAVTADSGRAYFSRGGTTEESPPQPLEAPP